MKLLRLFHNFGIENPNLVEFLDVVFTMLVVGLIGWIVYIVAKKYLPRLIRRIVGASRSHWSTWLLDQTFEFAQNMANAEDYLNIYMLLEVGFGLAFQLPLLIFYLSIFHLVPYKTFRSQWRIVYVGFMVLSAVVTPDASPVTMVLMFAILIFLYEAALAVARFIIVARDGKEALKWSREDYSNRDLENA